MSQVVLIRHGPTDWNVQGLIQGQSDVPLSAAGRADVARWRLPPGLERHDWFASPLLRAVETARLLGREKPILEPRLMEAHWGEWEGLNLKDLRAELGETLAVNERRGLDLTPPGGESPRMVRDRLASWLAEQAPRQRPLVAVCHAGVVRAAFSHATGWDMKAPAPIEHRHGFAHLFELTAAGSFGVAALNIALDPEMSPGADHA
jgi:broad specificity phosphatase PhoE